MSVSRKNKASDVYNTVSVLSILNHVRDAVNVPK
jgi:hypothetical protein